MKKFIKLGFVLIWCLVIFLFSNEAGTSSDLRSKSFISHTVSIYEKVVDGQVKQKEQFIDSWNFRVRKLAHFTIYFVLGILVFWALDDFFKIFSKRVLFSLLFCLIYAIFDEVHQVFTLGRAARLFDIWIDFLGSFFAVFIFFIFQKWKQIRLEQK